MSILNLSSQVFVLLAIVAAATAAPTFVVPSAPIARIDGAPIAHIGAATTYSHAIPSTFYSSSFAHGAIPTTYSAGVPTTYVAGKYVINKYHDWMNLILAAMYKNINIWHLF